MRTPKPLAAALAAILLIGAGCFGGGAQPTLEPITLEYWRTEDSPAALDAVIAEYKKLHPNVTVNVTQQREADYETTLLEALASDEGPDLYSIPNTWLAGWKGRILPLPREITIVAPQVQGEKIVVVSEKKPTMTLVEFRGSYVEGVTEELVTKVVETEGEPPVDRIAGLPFSADTLGMYYNKELFRKAGIEKPPASWVDFQDVAKRLTIADADGKISQAGAGIGWSDNVRHSAELLSAIMLQNGAQLLDAGGYARFQNYTPETTGRNRPPGVEGLAFYQGFVIPGSTAYAWNETMPDSLDAFVAGTSAIYFGLPSDMARIKERAPRLDVGVAPLPQVEVSRPKNILAYPVEVVSPKSAHADVAWDFLQFATSRDQVAPFLAATKRPTALRALIATQNADPAVGPFAGQVLTARRWYAGKDVVKARAAFDFMIETHPTAERPDLLRVVSEAAGRVNETLQ